MGIEPLGLEAHFHEDEAMITIKQIKNLHTACPSQWEGETDDGQDVYVRYRGGELSIEIGDSFVFCRFIDEHMTMEKMEKWVAQLKEEGLHESIAESMLSSHRNIIDFLPEGEQFSYHGDLKYERLVNQTKDLINWPATDDGEGVVPNFGPSLEVQ